MDLDKLIKEVFHSDAYTCTPLHKGYTNKNYLLQIGQKRYVLRIPYANSEHIVNRQHEEKAIHAVRTLKLDAPVVYFHAADGIKISSYIENVWEYRECPFPDKIERAAVLMKKLHQAKKRIGENFDPIQRYQDYKKHVSNPLFPLDAYEAVLPHIRQLSCKHVLCHNDWVSGNILLGEKDYLIDYEYSADNDPLFDVMSFLTENNIDDEKERQRFYNVYFDTFQTETARQLHIWETFHNLLWCTWAMMMWEQRKDPVYRQIAEDKYKALKKCCI